MHKLTNTLLTFGFLTTGTPMIAQIEAPEFGVPVLKCVEDQTPIDGPRTELRLQPDALGKYSVDLSVLNPWSGQVISNRLATRLPCTFANQDRRVVTCQRQALAGEPTNSGFESTIVEESTVGIDGQEFQNQYLDVRVYSPDIPNNQTSFTHRFPLDGCEVHHVVF